MGLIDFLNRYKIHLSFSGLIILVLIGIGIYLIIQHRKINEPVTNLSCLDPKTQEQILSEINKKLAEIDLCNKCEYDDYSNYEH